MGLSARYITSFLIIGIILFSSLPCIALEKENIIVVANKNVSKSVFLANYYVTKRGLSRAQRIILNTVTTETCTRSDYQRDIAEPVRIYLTKNKLEPNKTCFVLMYGLPLRINGSTSEGKAENRSGLAYDTGASVDSEISLVYRHEYPLSGWIDNPLYINNNEKSLYIDEKKIFMVSRIDGPTPESVKRIIDDSIEVEKKGLKGNACFDAQWPETHEKKIDAYTLFDQSIHMAAKNMIEKKIFPCKLETTKNLFQKGDCPNTALYCGWYSLSRYIDAFQWAQGAVAYHVASSECVTLKQENSQVWCKRMLEKGVAATLGPVEEPYLQSFPQPDIFFGFLYDGLCLAEAYIRSTPYLSWKMVLIGDPLYTPFKNPSPGR